MWICKGRKKELKNEWSNYNVKTVVERKEVGWKDVLGTRGEILKGRCV